ncbi:MAG: sigma-54-dependent Fis family transcriptional regulator [Flavobacteriales bacterium]|nr:sigma-54-dependent Fis family transcriptional regulator [Flavobacteriales bacterium]
MNKINAHICIIDDDESILFSLKLWLLKFYSEVSTFTHPKKIVLSTQIFPDLILLDMNFQKGNESGKEGMYWMQELKFRFPDALIFVFTAFGDVPLAIESLKKGAFDFILKPWDNNELVDKINTALQSHKKTEKKQVRNEELSFVWGKSKIIQQLKSQLEKIAPTEAKILILGENGTGKSALAKEIHQKSQRKNGKFISIDVGSINETLFESELFGYAKGAFTDAKKDKKGLLELAENGTLFIDEIANLSTQLQAKLLSVIQNRKYFRIGETQPRTLNARMIFATNEAIYEKVIKGEFRQDLLFRINTFEIELPALRNRKEDIPVLANYFFEKWKKFYQKNHLVLDKNCLEKLTLFSWQGNLRELENAFERAVILAEHQITIDEFADKSSISSEILDQDLKTMESKLIQLKLEEHQYNISHTANSLGISRAALYRKMKKFNISL